MENTTNTKIEEYHLVLQKFINYTLFGTLNNPSFENGIKSLQLQNEILDFYQLLSVQIQDQRGNFIDSFFRKLIINFHNIIKEKNIIDLMNCYGNSVFRLTAYLLNNINSHDPKNHFDANQKDKEILSELIIGDQFLVEISSYLAMQFVDFLTYIPYNEKRISKEQYQFLVDRYVCSYDYTKVTNIHYQNFNEID